MTARDNAAKLLREVKAVWPQLTPWDKCIVASQFVRVNSPEYIHIRNVATHFVPTPNVYLA